MNKSKALATTTTAVARPTMADVAAMANRASRAVVLTDYLEKKSPETIRRQEADLASFSAYLDEAGLDAGDLVNDLAAWQGCDFGLVDGFKRWLVTGGYSIGTVNVRLSTVKKYCTLAARAGHIPPTTLALIREVKGYTGREGVNVDTNREVTRIGKKKATWTSISYEQAEALKALDNPRDALLMCLLLNHGLRVSEVSGLTVDNFDLVAGTMTFYRKKVHKTQIHKLKDEHFDTLTPARVYIQQRGTAEKLFTAEAINQKVVDIQSVRDYTTRAINYHVGVLGRRVGLGVEEGQPPLSPHDCRHYWATRATRRGTHVRNLQQAGGWNSPYMALRYAEESAIANEGVIL